MGSIVAQDVFQRKLDAIFLDVPGVTGIADDMIIYGRSNLEISKNVTLPYFNPRSATILQTDASKKGLAAVILQDSRPVMFALGP